MANLKTLYEYLHTLVK